VGNCSDELNLLYIIMALIIIRNFSLKTAPISTYFNVKFQKCPDCDSVGSHTKIG